MKTSLESKYFLYEQVKAEKYLTWKKKKKIAMFIVCSGKIINEIQVKLSTDLLFECITF